MIRPDTSRPTRALLVGAFALLAVSCGGPTGSKAPDTSGPGGGDPGGAMSVQPSPLISDAVAGISHPDLAALFRDHWEWSMKQAPTWATTLGDHRYDDRLGDGSRAARDEAREQTRAFLARAEAIAASPGDALQGQDAITIALFIEQQKASIATEVCASETWNVSPYVGNPVAQFNYLPKTHRLESSTDVANLLARYDAISKAVDDIIANLERGAAAGMFGNAESVRRALEMVDRQLAQPATEWALLEPLDKIRTLAGADAEETAAGFERVVAEEIAPAYRRYREFLASRILPRARSGAQIGVHALPDGAACYAGRIQHFLALPRTAAELHQLGLDEIRTINGEMRVLGKKLFGTDDLAEILAKLRSDRALYFDSAEEMMAAAKRALDRANAAMPAAFGIKPRAECVVTPIPDYEAPFTTIAYYRPPHYDGSKPGEYFVNTYKPETRPRYEFQALSYHEAVPGHHLQYTIAMELPALPAARKFATNTAFGEGWALYTERLADELGLYDGDLDRMGMLSYDAWRASRLVVDTGIHAMGWTREQAEAYMLEHTALAANNIGNEVDRYIAWPGQALAYKVGQLEIFRLRRWAKGELGPAFSLPGFHDAVLGQGGVSLPIMARQVEAWVAEVKAGSAAK